VEFTTPNKELSVPTVRLPKRPLEIVVCGLDTACRDRIGEPYQLLKIVFQGLKQLLRLVLADRMCVVWKVSVIVLYELKYPYNQFFQK
jgi:hypothetical protein